MAAAAKHREAIVEAAVALFRRRGYAATGLNEILARSGAPKGSLYHYFPNGKAQLGREAVVKAGAVVTSTLTRLAADAPTAAAAVGDYLRLLASWLEQSDWRDGSPITTTLLEAAAYDTAIRLAGCEAFDAWSGVIADLLMRQGVERGRARDLANFAVAAMEGALVQAKVRRDAGPLVRAAEEIARLFEREVRTSLGTDTFSREGRRDTSR